MDDPDLIEIPVKTIDEPRHLVIGKIAEIYWSGVITYRGEKRRNISVRRSRKEEVEIYVGKLVIYARNLMKVKIYQNTSI